MVAREELEIESDLELFELTLEFNLERNLELNHDNRL